MYVWMYVWMYVCVCMKSFPSVGEGFKTIYTYAWFVGLALASIVYGAWMKLGKSPSARIARA